MKELEEYVQHFRLKMRELEAAKMPLHPTLALETLEAATEDIPELAALFEDHELSEMKTTDALLDRLENKFVKWREKQEEHQKDNSAEMPAVGDTVVARAVRRRGLGEHDDALARERRRKLALHRIGQLDLTIATLLDRWDARRVDGIPVGADLGPREHLRRVGREGGCAVPQRDRPHKQAKDALERLEDP